MLPHDTVMIMASHEITVQPSIHPVLPSFSGKHSPATEPVKKRTVHISYINPINLLQINEHPVTAYYTTVL